MAQETIRQFPAYQSDIHQLRELADRIAELTGRGPTQPSDTLHLAMKYLRDFPPTKPWLELNGIIYKGHGNAEWRKVGE